MPGQFDEDKVMHSLFPPGFVGKMVDVGAYDPVLISNSWYFEQKGWDVLCIEPNPNLIPLLKGKRENVLQIACGKENKDQQAFEVYTMTGQPGFEGPEIVHEGAITGLKASELDGQKEVIKERWWQGQKHRNIITDFKEILVDVRTLDWCLEQMKWDNVHIVSIDVEGTEQDVLDGFDIDGWMPVVMCIENWWKDNRYEKYLKEFGFNLVMRTGDEMNEIYMHPERMRVIHELSS